MTDNILHATSRRVTRVHTLTQDGEPYLGDVTHFFVTEDGWEEFTTTMMKTHAPYNTLDEEEEPYVINGDTIYGPIKILYKQYTLYTTSEHKEVKQ